MLIALQYIVKCLSVVFIMATAIGLSNSSTLTKTESLFVSC